MDDFYTSYDQLMPRICPDYLSNLERAAALIPNKTHTIIELGSGTGNLTLRILHAHDNITITGIENQEQLITLARKKDYTGRATFHNADLKHVPIKGYAGVVSALTLHHLEQEEKYALYHKILTASTYFINYDRILLPEKEEKAIRAFYLDFIRQNGFPEEVVARARDDMETHDKPLPLDVELAPFRNAGWSVSIAHMHNGFVIYKTTRST